MLNDDFPEMCGGKSMTPRALGGTPVTIHLTVTDVDEKFQRAVDAGATVVVPLEDQFWGDRYGMVADPFGHQWSLGQPVREVSYDDIQAASPRCSAGTGYRAGPAAGVAAAATAAPRPPPRACRRCR